MANYVKPVVFLLGKEMYGVDINLVQSIEKDLNVVPVPNSQSYIKGIVNMRNEVIPVYSLARKFGKEQEATAESTIIISSGGLKLALEVDEVLEINDIDDALDKWYIKLFLSSNYEKLKNYYYFELQNNKNMIETLKRKLQKIDEIEKNIVNLFDNGILSNINYAVDILKQSYESKDFSPITYPDVMLFYKLGNLKIDSVSLQGDRIGLNTDFITIIDDNGMLLEKFGGDQSWLDDSVSDSSCGVIAIVNTYLYMTGQTTITKKDYIELCKRFLNENKFDNILIEKNFGALPSL